MLGSGLNAAYCATSLEVMAWKRWLSSSVHQSRKHALAVELAALVVEAVADLVADHGADAP